MVPRKVTEHTKGLQESAGRRVMTTTSTATCLMLGFVALCSVCVVVVFSVFFFFSSRRRHTRLVSDWSSDVCSSDLAFHGVGRAILGSVRDRGSAQLQRRGEDRSRRSEERRVGKECRSRWSPYH